MVRPWILPAWFILLISAPCIASGPREVEIIYAETYGEKNDRLLEQFGDPPPEDGVVNVLTVPTQDDVTILTVRFATERELYADLYYPPGVRAGRRERLNAPVIIFPCGFSMDNEELWGAGVRFNTALTSWAALFAVHGVVTVIYDSAVLDQDFRSLLAWLERHEEPLGLDLSRLGLWATSGHGYFGGIAMGDEVVEGRLRAVMFMHADPRPTLLPEGDIEYYLIYSEDDSRWHRMLGSLARRAQMAGYPVTSDTRAKYKGFFQFDDSQESIDVVQTAVEWMCSRLLGLPAAGD